MPASTSVFRTFRWSLLLTIVVLVGSFFWRGWDFALVVLILGILEVVFSFDNAVVNSKILVRMSPFWQKMFLTVGIAIAVFGMRLIFPVAVVVFTAGLSIGQVWNLALYQPEVYAEHLHDAHPAIAALGGMFLLMLFLDWLFDSERELHWLPGERWLANIGKEDIAASVLGLLGLVVVANYLAGDHTTEVIQWGLYGWLAYQVVNLIDKFTEREAEAESIDARQGPSNLKLATGLAGFVLFLKLELIDASFSFDGVSGAFAISRDIFAIMIGLGVGALFVRSLTVHLTNRGTLKELVFLEHGAHWAIGALAVILLGTMQHELPEWFTGLIGVGIIVAAYLSSLIYRRRHPQTDDEALEVIDAPDAPAPAHR